MTIKYYFLGRLWKAGWKVGLTRLIKICYDTSVDCGDPAVTIFFKSKAIECDRIDMQSDHQPRADSTGQAKINN